MKNLNQFALLLICIATLTTITSCKKYKLNRETTTSEDASTSDNLFDDVFNVLEDVDFSIGLTGKNKNGSSGWCGNDTTFMIDSIVTVTREFLDTTRCFPRRLTVDYGAGYVGKDGRERKGVVMLERTGRYREDGSKSTYTTDEYYVDDYKVEGTRSITNNGPNSKGNTEFTVKLTGGKITTPNNDVMTRESERTREWIKGENTLLIWRDDVYLIRGGGSGTNRNGRDYTVDITSDLRLEVDCRWLTKGVVELTPKDLKTRSLDYGNGTCDDQAEVTIGKKVKTITLRK